MKKISTVILFLSCLTIVYSQEINEKEGKKVLEQIRKEIQIEERTKQKEAEKAEKTKMKLEKEEEKKGKKVLEDIRRDMNESLEEKVFRSKDNPEEKAAAVITAFEIGEERMSFLKMEEEEIKELENALGTKGDENRVFLSEKFDGVHEEFKLKNHEIQTLSSENEMLNEYLSKLDTMEQKVKTGKN
ncbi:hypothetical protein [Fusobacterium varium]|uniref:hypothetical protein n=1 Tax=Fusobacterium varium TaxID=856 RepID=UPI001F1CB6D8|nr:hypothetical protein [Fusobacterium varium]MCF2672666.1 hypothetical protein [Fusobacterium varium]